MAAAAPAAASGPVRVDVGSLTLTPAIKRDIDVADVWVEVDMLGLAEASQLRTKRVHKSSANLDFGFSLSVPVASGSKQQSALRAALSSSQEQDSDVYFVVKTLTARNQEREVGQGYLNLQTLLRDGRDAASVSLPLQGKQGAAGQLVVSLSALDALRGATGAAAPVAAAAPAARAAPVPVASISTTARGLSAPAGSALQPATASAFLASLDQPARSSEASARPTAVATPSTQRRQSPGPSSPPRDVRSTQQAAGSASPLQKVDDQLVIRIESLTLAPSYQVDTGISRMFISLKVLGSEFNTRDLTKTSTPPIQVGETFKIQVSEKHVRAREELLRAMHRGDRSSADITLTLCYYESGVGGEEGLELAAGKINLRDIWSEKQDFASRQVPLLEEGLEETCSVTISSSVVRALALLLNKK